MGNKGILLAIELLKEEGFLLYHAEYEEECIGEETPDHIIDGAKFLIYAADQNAVIISSSNCPLCGEDCIDNKWFCNCLTEEEQELFIRICEEHKI
jgi:hypothetical protein